MSRLKLAALLSAFALVVLPGLGPSAAYAGEQPNVLVMGEDADPDTVPRNHRVFNRVIEALATELGQLGFQVYDETAVSLDVTRQGRIRRSDAELITVAKRIQQPPIDVIAVFSIYVNVQENINADIWDLGIRIPGRLLQVQTGRRSTRSKSTTRSGPCRQYRRTASTTHVSTRTACSNSSAARPGVSPRTWVPSLATSSTSISPTGAQGVVVRS